MKSLTNQLVWLYTRVSSEEQAKDAYGLESQEAACRKFCEERGWIVETVYSDPGFSAWKESQLRPEFRRMMQELRKRHDVTIVFYDYSRFSRDMLTALQAFDQLEKLGVRAVSVRNPDIDSRTANGRRALLEEFGRAEYFSHDNSEKTSERMRLAFERGRFLRTAPLGYLNAKTRDKNAPNIVPFEEEARLVRKAFELMATGMYRAADVLVMLTGLGLRSRKGKKLTLTTFLKLLKNPVYIGQIKSDKWKQVREGIHQGIVDRDVFANIQLVLKGKKPITAPYQKNRPDLPLRGLLRCGGCAALLTGGFSKGKTGKLYGYYHCYRCRAVKSVPTQQAEGQFAALLTRLRPTPLLLSDFDAILREEWQRSSGDNEALVRRLKADLRQRQQSLEKLTIKYVENDRAIMPVYEQMSCKLLEDISALQTQIAESEQERASFQELKAFSKTVLTDIASAWSRAGVDQRQRVQNALFPNGLIYAPGKGILNSDRNCLFSHLEAFVAGKMSMARPERFELPTY